MALTQTKRGSFGFLKKTVGSFTQSRDEQSDDVSRRKPSRDGSDYWKVWDNDARLRRGSTVTAFLYPMWVMPMDTFLSMDGFVAHQRLLEQGKLVEYDAIAHHGRVIFVSHQWAGFDHPDVDNQLFDCLRDTLLRMVKGKVKTTRATGVGRLLGQDMQGTAKEWKRRLPGMFIWFDFMSVPQPAYELASLEKARPIEGGQSTSAIQHSDHRYAFGDIQEEESKEQLIPRPDTLQPPGVVMPTEDDEKCAAGLRASAQTKPPCPPRAASFTCATEPKPRKAHSMSSTAQAKKKARIDDLTSGLQNAVQSLPGYVENASIMVVLAPTVIHKNLPDTCCDLRSWRSRGWCRLETLAAYLSRRNIQILQILSPCKDPKFVPYQTLMAMVPSHGIFACCERGHRGPRGEEIECDKLICNRIIRAMVQAKRGHLASVGRLDAMRFLMTTKNHFLGQTTVGRRIDSMSSSTVFGAQTLEAFAHALEWNVQDSDRGANVTGLTLVFWASIANNATALQEAIYSSEDPVNDVNRPFTDHADKEIFLTPGMTPLIIAVASGSMNCVKLLLESGANTRSGDRMGRNAFDFALTMGPPGILKVWKKRFPKAFRKSRRSKWSPLFAVLLFRFSNLAEATALILDEGVPIDDAGIEALTGVRMTVLHGFAKNDWADSSMEHVFDAHPAFLKHIDTPVVIKRKRLAAYMRICKLAKKGNIKLPYSKKLLRLAGCTPLHMAAGKGNATMVKMLIRAGADITVRNAAGQTALEAARDAYGGQAPLAIQQLLGSGIDDIETL